jgi:hypothetical protein
VNTLTTSPEYTALLREIAPKIIRTEQENEAYTEILYELDRRSRISPPPKKNWLSSSRF